MRDGTITINVIPIPPTSGQGRGITMDPSAPARQRGWRAVLPVSQLSGCGQRALDLTLDLGWI